VSAPRPGNYQHHRFVGSSKLTKKAAPTVEAAIEDGYRKAQTRRRGRVTLRVVDIFVIGSNPITEYRVVLEVT
jgi:flavin-binding protein dodecin